MPEKTYGEMLDEMVDRAAKHDDRSAIFRRNEIPRGHFYNVINPNRSTSGGNPFHTPIEWMVKLTRDLTDYCMLKKVARDCNCILITPDDLKELKETDPAKALDMVAKLFELREVRRGMAGKEPLK